MSRGRDEGFWWYCLSRINGLGPKRINRIYDAIEPRGMAIEELFRMEPTHLRGLVPAVPEQVLEAMPSADFSVLEGEFQELEEAGVRLVHLEHEYYPRTLRARLQGDAPPILFCLGYTSLLSAPSVAIIGARSASEESQERARQLAGELASEGKNIVSGYAKGVDSQAHLGALSKGGTTTAVLANGILHFETKKDWEDVDWERSFLAVSDLDPKLRWMARNAMARNRLVCALVEAVLVIEAGAERNEEGKMSGTLQAGLKALELGVPLFVLSPEDLKSAAEGNRQLIEKGGLELRKEDATCSLLHRLRDLMTEASTDLPKQEQQITLF